MPKGNKTNSKNKWEESVRNRLCLADINPDGFIVWKLRGYMYWKDAKKIISTLLKQQKRKLKEKIKDMKIYSAFPLEEGEGDYNQAIDDILKLL